MNIYLDIDGVLLTKKGEPAFYVEKFLRCITDNFDCYWLTTHCKGNAEHTERYLNRIFDNNRISDLLKKIKPTNWDTLKTEAIDFSSNFRWIDDCVFRAKLKN